MNINPLIFRAYDIRGIAEVNEKNPVADLTPETVELIGLAAGTYLQRKYNTKNMVIGRDNRLHSELLQTAFIQGIRKTGIQVTNMGLATSPLLYFAVCHFGFESGVNITASHNPKEYNGIKIVRENGASVADQELQEILKLIQNQDFTLAAELTPLEEKNDIFEEYLKFTTQNTKLERPLKIVVDCGNGVAGMFAPKLLRAIGCDVTEIYCDLDGNFPNHEANPEEAHNMIDLGKKVLETKANLGIGFDGDGDRVGVVDENAQHYPAEYLIMLLARDFLKSHPGEKVIFDVKVSNNLINDITKNGGLAMMSKTGHSFIEEKIRHENASLAGENSGHIFFGKKHYNSYGYDDGMFAACKVLEVLSKTPLQFSEHFIDLPKLYSTPELKIPCPDERKFIVVKEITEFFQTKFPSITLDGIRVNFDETSWGAVRCSNTTPNLTMRFESASQEKLAEIQEIMFSELRKFPEVQLPSSIAH